MIPWYRSWAQLVRLPNLPTTMADIALAGLATGLLAKRVEVFVLLLLASCCLYMSGMVWNDFFDVAQDRKERPERPIPSGRISRRTAGLGAGALMLLGVVLAFLSGYANTCIDESASLLLPGGVALMLVAAIFAYDGWLKHTVLGPVAMGSCRFFNVLLGVSIAGSLVWPLGPLLALIVGLYIVGVTWFARTEARVSSRTALTGAVVVMLASLLLAPCAAAMRPEGTPSPLFVYALVAFGFWLGFPLWKAIESPTPSHVQRGVKRSLMGLILLDTILAMGTAGTIGIGLLILLGPSIYLNTRRWLYAT